MRIYILLPLSFLVTSCASGPYAQNPDEYIHYFENSNNAFVNALKKKETVSVSRPEKSVVSDISKLASSCINGVIVNTTLTQGMQRETSSVRHTAKVGVTTSKRKAFSLQMESVDSKVKAEPEDGAYMMVADMKATGQNQTAITIYYAPGSVYSNIAVKIKEWAAGGKKECPKLTW